MTDALDRLPFRNRLGVRPGKPSLVAMIGYACERWGVAPAEVTAKYPPNWIIPASIREARAEIFMVAQRQGVKITALAAAVGRDHSTLYKSWRAHG